MRILFLKNNLLSILGILIGVLFFTCLTKLSDKAMCEEYKLFSKKGVRIKAVVDHFSNYRALHYVSFKFELNGCIYVSEDQVIRRNLQVGDTVYIYVIPDLPGKIISEENFKLMGCD